MDGWIEGRMEGEERGRSLLFMCVCVSLARSLSLSPRLFGEFADDTDQCSIFIFKTLVVCFQVNQNLVVQIKLTLQYKYIQVDNHISFQCSCIAF